MTRTSAVPVFLISLAHAFSVAVSLQTRGFILMIGRSAWIYFILLVPWELTFIQSSLFQEVGSFGFLICLPPKIYSDDRTCRLRSNFYGWLNFC